MPKTKSTAAWHGLSPAQRQTLERWLCDDGLSYDEALERARKELNFTGSRTSLRRFYERTARERTLADFAATAATAHAIAGTRISTEQLRDAALKVAAQIFLQQVTETPARVKEWAPLARFLLQSEDNQLRRQLKSEENAIRRETLQFARARFQHNNIEAALRILPQLEELAESRKDPEVQRFEENKRVNDIRRSMFGDVLPELFPENEEEEAHPEIIEQRFQAALQRQYAQYQREHEERQRAAALQDAARRAEAAAHAANVADSPSPEPAPEPSDPSPADEPAEGQGTDPTAPEPESEPEPPPEPFTDEPPKKSPEERDREYAELMQRARGELPGTPTGRSD